MFGESIKMTKSANEEFDDSFVIFFDVLKM